MSSAHMASDSRPATISAPDNLPVRATSSVSGRAALGYDIGAWSLELGAGKLNRYSETRNWQAFSGGRYNANDDFQDIVVQSIEADVRAKYNLQFTERVTVYPLFGAALVHWDRELDNCIPSCQNVQFSHGNTIRPQLGIGLEYKAFRHASLTAEYVATAPVLGIRTQQVLLGLKVH